MAPLRSGVFLAVSASALAEFMNELEETENAVSLLQLSAKAAPQNAFDDSLDLEHMTEEQIEAALSTSGRVCTLKEAQGVCTSASERLGSMQSGLTVERCQNACAADPSCTNAWSIMNFRCQLYSSCDSFRAMSFRGPVKMYECAEEEVVSAVGDPHITTNTGRHFDLSHPSLLGLSAKAA